MVSYIICRMYPQGSVSWKEAFISIVNRDSSIKIWKYITYFFTETDSKRITINVNFAEGVCDII